MPVIEQVQAGESPAVDLIDQLPQGVQALVPHVAADSLDGLHLVENDQQAGAASVAEDRQQTLEEVKRPEMVDLSLYPRLLAWRPPRRSADRPARPAGRLPWRVSPTDLGLAVAPQGGTEHRGCRPSPSPAAAPSACSVRASSSLSPRSPPSARASCSRA